MEKQWKDIFKYADGREGTCTENGTARLFDDQKEAEAFAAELNDCISEECKAFFPVWHAVEA